MWICVIYLERLDGVTVTYAWLGVVFKMSAAENPNNYYGHTRETGKMLTWFTAGEIKCNLTMKAM